MKKRVYIWGTGTVTVQYLDTGELNEENLLGFIESRRTKDCFYGKKVYEPQEIKNDEYDYILVCVYRRAHAIYQTALKNGIMPKKMIFIDNWEWIDGTPLISGYPFNLCRRINQHNDVEEVKKIFPKLYKKLVYPYDMKAERFIAVQTNGYDLTHKDSVLIEEDYKKDWYWSDYFRYRSFELMVNEIVESDVKGAIAELGVFRGKFSKLLNKKFKDRMLYLFDTFDSFDIHEFRDEVDKGRCEEDFYSIYKNTSEKVVLDDMPYPQNCIIRKGFFPKTSAGLEDEEYAFVSIDVDLKESILAGLRYFYPRLNYQGVIFLHDYNNYFLDGVREAVIEYQKEINERLIKVPLADEGGTLVICK